MIIDNGKGFDLNQSRKGIGLANIRNRAEALMAPCILIPPGARMQN